MHQAEAVFLYAYDSYHKLTDDIDTVPADKVLKYKMFAQMVMSESVLADIYKLISEIYRHERAK
jgi:hypothetical protein